MTLGNSSTIAAAAALVLSAAPAFARELHWRSVDVAARLESDGSLLVRETQAMVFTGDWNGGERIFRLENGQSLDLLRMVRVDPATAAETVLRPGDLDQVDEYKRWLVGGNPRRWVTLDSDDDSVPLRRARDRPPARRQADATVLLIQPRPPTVRPVSTSSPGSVSARNPRTAAITWSGSSSCGQCPAPASSTTRAPGSVSRQRAR